MTCFRTLACVLFIFLPILSSAYPLNAQEGINLTAPFRKCREIKNSSIAIIASDNEINIFLLHLNGQIKAFEENQEEIQNEIWSLDIGGEVAAEPLFAGKTLYVLSKQILPEEMSARAGIYENTGYFITAVDTLSGVSRSKNKPYLKFFENKLYIFTDTDNLSLLSILDISDGQIVSERELNFRFSQFYNAEGSLIAGKNDSFLVSYSINKGESKFFKNFAVNIETASVKGRDIVFSDKKGNLYFADEATGAVRKSKIRFGAKITFIKLFRDRLLLASNDNFLYSISADGKKIFWKKRLAGRITSEPVIFRGTVVTYSQGDNSLYFIDFEDGKVLNRIANEREIINKPLVTDGFVVLQTDDGFSLYKTADCKTSTAAKK
jgi:outer membrane protein assembly factor BamB